MSEIQSISISYIVKNIDLFIDNISKSEINDESEKYFKKEFIDIVNNTQNSILNKEVIINKFIFNLIKLRCKEYDKITDVILYRYSNKISLIDFCLCIFLSYIENDDILNTISKKIITVAKMLGGLNGNLIIFDINDEVSLFSDNLLFPFKDSITSRGLGLDKEKNFSKRVDIIKDRLNKVGTILDSIVFLNKNN